MIFVVSNDFLFFFFNEKYPCSIHGLIRGENMELGRDSDTGGQVISCCNVFPTRYLCCYDCDTSFLVEPLSSLIFACIFIYYYYFLF